MSCSGARRASLNAHTAQKEKERKKKQKAAKRAAAVGNEEQQRRERQREAAQRPVSSDEAQQPGRAPAQQHGQRQMPAAATGVGPQECRNTTDAAGQPASGPAPMTQSAISPTMQFGVFSAASAGGGATAQAAATTATSDMDVVPHEGGRMSAAQERPAVEPAPSPPEYVWGVAAGAAAGASAPAAAEHKAKFQRPAASMPKGAAVDAPNILYTSRPDGTVFGMAGMPGEKWARGK